MSSPNKAGNAGEEAPHGKQNPKPKKPTYKMPNLLVNLSKQ
jgi:hypothetical protein